MRRLLWEFGVMRTLAPLLLLATMASAQIPDEQTADAARTSELNRAIQQNNDQIAIRNEAAQAAYRREHADYDAARAENDKARLAAEAAATAFAAAQAQHRADMARWQAQIAAPRQSPPKHEKVASRPPAAASRCLDEVATGSLMRKPSCRSPARRDADLADVKAFDTGRSPAQ